MPTGESSIGPRSPWRAVLLALGVAALGFLVGWRTIAGWDIWWHLSIGREALATGGSVPLDTFSFSFAGQPYVHKDLGGDIVLSWLFGRFGFEGLALLRAVMLSVAFGAIVLTGRDQKPSAALAVVVAGAFVIAVQQRIIPRPMVFTLAFFPVTLMLIERARAVIRSKGTTRTFAIALLPLIPLLWIWLNLHRGGLIGLVLIAGHACALGLGYVLHRVPRLRRIAGPRPSLPMVLVGFGVFGLAALAGLLNVSGLDLYTSGLSVTQDTIHRTLISEWQPLSWELAKTYHAFGLTFVALTCGVLFFRIGRALLKDEDSVGVDVWHVGVLALFILQGVASMRWLTYAYTAAAVISLRGLGSIRTRIQVTRGLAGFALVVVAAAVHLTSTHELGLGEEPNRYPGGALSFAAEQGLGERVHNNFVYGGYITFWSGGHFRTLIDGRNDMVYPSEFFRDCSMAQRDPQLFEQLWEAHDGDWVLADNTPGRENFLFLAVDPEWVAVYWSEAAIVYVPRGRYPSVESAFALRAINPIDPVASLGAALQRAGTDPAAFGAIRDELMRGLAESPDGVRTNALTIIFFDYVGDHASAMERLDHLERIAPNHPAVIQMRERIGG